MPATLADLEFPTTVGPFTMSRASLAKAFNAFYRQHQFPRPDPESDENSMAGLNLEVCGFRGVADIVFCQLSPLYEITLDDETKRAANIPVESTTFAWAYPVVDDGSLQKVLASGTAEGAFLQFGGYVYFNNHREILATNSITPASPGTLGLMFGRRQALVPGVVEALTKQGRFQEITLDFFVSKGASHFAWIRPDEFQAAACPNGAFAYKFRDGSSSYFPVVTSPIFSRELLQEELDNDEAWAVIRLQNRPSVESIMIFSKEKPIEENVGTQREWSNAKIEVDVSLDIWRESDADRKLTYDEWCKAEAQGTISDPWIFSITGEMETSLAAILVGQE